MPDMFHEFAWMPRPVRLMSVLAIVCCVAAIALSAMTVDGLAGPVLLAQSTTSGKEDPIRLPPPDAGRNDGEPPWAITCGDNNQRTSANCRIMQNISVRKTGQRLLTAFVFRREGEKNYSLLLALPHGLDLPTGISLQVDDGEPVKLPVKTSDPQGVYAGLAPSADFLGRMKSGKRLTVSMKVNNQKELSVPLRLDGLDTALKRYEALN